MAEEKASSQRNSRLTPPPTGSGNASYSAYRNTQTPAQPRTFGFGSSSSRLTTTPGAASTARTSTFSRTAFGRTVATPAARPQRPSSAENSSTRLRQKPASATTASPFGSASSAPKQSAMSTSTSRTATTKGSDTTTTSTTTTHTATSSSLYSSLSGANAVPRSGSFPSASPSYATTVFSASASANASAASSSSVAKPAGQLFSMDDSDLGNEDDWGVDSPNILSPASATQDDAAATAAGKSFEEEECGWADETTPAALDHSECIQPAPVAVPVVSTVVVAAEQPAAIALHEQLTVECVEEEQHPAPLSSSSPLTAAWGDEFAYEAEATEATAAESAWNDDAWEEDDTIDAMSEATAFEVLDAPTAVAGVDKVMSPTLAEETVFAVQDQAAHTTPEVSAPLPPMVSADLAAVLSPTSAPAGEFWGDESDGGLFSEEEQNEEPLAVETPPLDASAALPMASEMARGDEEETVQADAACAIVETVLEEAPMVSASNGCESYHHEETQSVGDEMAEAVEEKTEWNDDGEWQEEGEEGEEEKLLMETPVAAEIVAENTGEDELSSFPAAPAAVECTPSVSLEETTAVESGVPVQSHDSCEHNVSEVTERVNEFGFSDDQAYGDGQFYSSTGDSTGFFGGHDAYAQHQHQYAHDHQQQESHSYQQQEAHVEQHQHRDGEHLHQQQHEYSHEQLQKHSHEEYSHDQQDMYAHPQQQQQDMYTQQQYDEYWQQQQQQQVVETETATETRATAESSYGSYHEHQSELTHSHGVQAEDASSYKQQQHQFFGTSAGDYAHAHTHVDESGAAENGAAPDELSQESAPRQISWATHQPHVEVDATAEESITAEEEDDERATSASLSFAPTKADAVSFGSSSFGAAELTFGHYHHDHHHRTPSETEGGSVTSSFAEVSSAGATFGGSDNVSDDAYSENGSVSETRSMFGSSSVGTAFITEPPSSSDGQDSVEDVGPIDRDSDASSAFRVGGGPYSSEFDVSSTKSTLFENEVASTGFDQGEDAYSFEEQSNDHHFGSSSYENDDFGDSEVSHDAPFNDEASSVSAHFGSEAESEFSSSSVSFAADARFSSSHSLVSAALSTTPTAATYDVSPSSQDLPTASDLEFDHVETENPFASSSLSDHVPSPFEAVAPPPPVASMVPTAAATSESLSFTTSTTSVFAAENTSFGNDADQAQEVEEDEDANPFASSGGSSAFASPPLPAFAFGAASRPPVPDEQSAQEQEESLPSAASLFGATPPKNTPFASFTAPPPAPSHPAPYDEQSTADAGSLFADAPAASGFGGFHQSTASASGLFGGETGASSSSSSYGYGYESPAAPRYGAYDDASPQSATDAFGVSSASHGFASGGSADAVFGGHRHSTDYSANENTTAFAPAEVADASSFFGGGSSETASAADMFGSSEAAAYQYGEYADQGHQYAQNEYAGEYHGQYDQSEYAIHAPYEETQASAPAASSAHGFLGDHTATVEESLAHGQHGGDAPSVDQYETTQSSPAEYMDSNSTADASLTSEFFSSSAQHDDGFTVDATSAESSAFDQHQSFGAPPLARGTSSASSHVDEHKSIVNTNSATYECATEAKALAQSHETDSFFGRSSSTPPAPPVTSSSSGGHGSNDSASVPPPRSNDSSSFHASSVPPTDSSSFFGVAPPSPAASAFAPPVEETKSDTNAMAASYAGYEKRAFSSSQHEFENRESTSRFESHAAEHAHASPAHHEFAEHNVASHDETSHYFGGNSGGATGGAAGGVFGNNSESAFESDSSAFFGGDTSSSSGPFGHTSGDEPSSFFSSGPGQHHHSGGIYAQPPPPQQQARSSDAASSHHGGYDATAYGHHQYDHHQQHAFGSAPNGFAPEHHAGGSHNAASPAAAPAPAIGAHHATSYPGFGATAAASSSHFESSSAYGSSAASSAAASSQFPSSPYAASGHHMSNVKAAAPSYTNFAAASHQPHHDASYRTPTFQPSTPHFDPSPLRPAESKPAYSHDYASPKAEAVPSYGLKYETKSSFGPTAATVFTSSKYKDPTMAAPSCLVSFGFGGNVVTMIPKQKLRLNGAAFGARNSPRTPIQMQHDSLPQGELRKGPVGVYRMEHLHPKNSDLEELDRFPGPLHDGVAEEAVLQFVEDKMNASTGASPYEEDERLLLGVLKVLIKCNGKLRSDANANPSDPASPEVQLVSLLKESDQRRRSHQPSIFPPPKPVQYSTHADATARNASRVRELLLLGDRKAAVDVAIQAHMWPEAMLIASFTDKDEYKRVLCAYFTSHYAPGDPCRALYLSFADQQEKSVHEPQKLLQLQQQLQHQSEDNSAILSSWVVHVQMLLANRTADTNKILVELGDRLWKEADAVVAAHICYLLAGNTVEAPSPMSKIALLGADHRAPEEARFYVSPSAVQRTEIYEWVHKKVNPAATNLIPFQGYKLIYAMVLADHGKLETAFKYVNSMLTVIRAIMATMKPGASMYLEGMQNQLVVLDDRLRQHLGQDRADSVAAAASAKQGKWGLGSALSIMGKIVNRVVEGNDAPQQASGPPSTNGSLFQGAPRSINNNANPTPEYPSAAAIGYPTQPAAAAAAPSSGRGGGAPFGPRSGSGHTQPMAPTTSYQAPTSTPGSAPHSRSGRSSAPPYQPTPDYMAPLSGNGGNAFGAPSAPQYQQQQHQQQQQYHQQEPPRIPAPALAPLAPTPPAAFMKPSLDLTGDAGKTGFGNDGQLSPSRRVSESIAQPKSPRALGDGPGSDKGSSSPKIKDTKKGGRSKTPPPSRTSSSGWLTGLSTFIAAKMNPEAKVAKLGEQMEAYFDEEKKRWVFPGESQTEEAARPSAPPTGPLPGSTPGSSSGGPPGGGAGGGAGGPPSVHSAPGSMAGGGSTADDPLAALMAPPPSRAHATLMHKDPLSAMMAPPPNRAAFGQQRASTMPAKRPPPRPQFAVFKPAPSSNASASSAPSDHQGPPSSSSGDAPAPPPSQ